MVIRLPQPKKNPAHPYQRQPIQPNTQRWQKQEMMVNGLPTTRAPSKLSGGRALRWQGASRPQVTWPLLFRKHRGTPRHASAHRTAVLMKFEDLRTDWDWKPLLIISVISISKDNKIIQGNFNVNITRRNQLKGNQLQEVQGLLQWVVATIWTLLMFYWSGSFEP